MMQVLRKEKFVTPTAVLESDPLRAFEIRGSRERMEALALVLENNGFVSANDVKKALRIEAHVVAGKVKDMLFDNFRAKKIKISKGFSRGGATATELFGDCTAANASYYVTNVDRFKEGLGRILEHEFAQLHPEQDQGLRVAFGRFMHSYNIRRQGLNIKYAINYLDYTLLTKEIESKRRIGSGKALVELHTLHELIRLRDSNLSMRDVAKAMGDTWANASLFYLFSIIDHFEVARPVHDYSLVGIATQNNTVK